MIVADRVELVDDLEARLAPEVVDRRHVTQHLEAEVRVIAQRLERREHTRALDHDDGLTA